MRRGSKVGRIASRFHQPLTRGTTDTPSQTQPQGNACDSGSKGERASAVPASGAAQDTSRSSKESETR
jgi:hypothetical protein